MRDTFDFLKGIVRVKLVDSETGKVLSDDTHNFIDNTFKRLMLAKGVSQLLIPNTGSLYGMLYSFEDYETRPKFSSGGSVNMSKIPDSPALVLLNLDDSVTLDANTKFLNILNSQGDVDLGGKVVGYSNGRLTSSVNNIYEGVLDITSPVDMLSLKTVGRSVYFDTGKATGSFNWIAMMPGFEESPFKSLLVFKCITNYNVRNTGDTFGYGYLRPGVTDGSTVITTDQEIMLFFTKDGVNRWKYNIVTGELKGVAPTDPANTFNINKVSSIDIGNQIVYNNSLFVINSKTLYKLNAATGDVEGSIEVAYDYTNSKRHFGLFIDNGNIVVSSGYNTDDGTSDYKAYVAVVNPSNMSIVSTTQNVLYTGWGGLPTKWGKNRTFYTKANNLYYVYNIEADGVIVCSDISNVCGSIVCLLPSRGMNIIETGSKVYHYSCNELINDFVLGDETQPDIKNMEYYGFWLADETTSNFWSAAKMTETKVKSANTKAYIGYSYTVSDDTTDAVVTEG